MGLDIRWPIGLMFSLIGVLLIVYGVVNGADCTSCAQASTSTFRGASSCSCLAC